MPRTLPTNQYDPTLRCEDQGGVSDALIVLVRALARRAAREAMARLTGTSAGAAELRPEQP